MRAAWPYSVNKLASNRCDMQHNIALEFPCCIAPGLQKVIQTAKLGSLATNKALTWVWHHPGHRVVAIAIIQDAAVQHCACLVVLELDIPGVPACRCGSAIRAKCEQLECAPFPVATPGVATRLCALHSRPVCAVNMMAGCKGLPRARQEQVIKLGFEPFLNVLWCSGCGVLEGKPASQLCLHHADGH